MGKASLGLVLAASLLGCDVDDDGREPGALPGGGGGGGGGKLDCVDAEACEAEPAADGCVPATPDAVRQPVLASIHARAIELRDELADPANQARRGTRSFKGAAWLMTKLLRHAMQAEPRPQTAEEFEQRLQWVTQVVVGVGEPVAWGSLPAYDRAEVGGLPSGYVCQGLGYADDTEPMFDDCSNNQAFHSFFYVWLSYFSGASWASIGNAVHEEGYLSDLVRAVSPGGGTLPDYLVAVAAIQLGQALDRGSPLPGVYDSHSIDVAYGARMPAFVSTKPLMMVSDSTDASGSPDASEDNVVAAWPADDAAAVSFSKYFFDEKGMAEVLLHAQAIDPELLRLEDLARVGLDPNADDLALQRWLFETPVTFDNLDVMWWLVVGNSTGRDTRPCELPMGKAGSTSPTEIRGVLLESPQRLGLGLGNR